MSLLDTYFELLLLRFIEAQALVANVFPSEEVPGLFFEGACRVKQNPNERALVSPSRFPVLPGHRLDLGMNPEVLLQRVFGPHNNQCDCGLIRYLAALAREEDSLDALLTGDHS